MQSNTGGDSPKHIPWSPVLSDQTPVIADRSSDSRQSYSSNMELAMQAGRLLARSPSSLRNACENACWAAKSVSKSLSQQQRLRQYICNCSIIRERQTYRAGHFNFTRDYSAAHTAQCPYYNRHARSWGYSLTALMLPILHVAVRIIFTATRGAGGHSIGISLRYFGVIQRSKSSAYRLFDRFPDLCARKCYAIETCPNREAHRGQYCHDDLYPSLCRFIFEWDVELIKVELHNLHRDLFLLLTNGYVLASCSDEHGNTLLHVRSRHFITYML